jgi:hypothetical protein
MSPGASLPAFCSLGIAALALAGSGCAESPLGASFGHTFLLTCAELGLVLLISTLLSVTLFALARLTGGLTESLLARGLEALGALPLVVLCAALTLVVFDSALATLALVVGSFGGLRTVRIVIRRFTESLGGANLPLSAGWRRGFGALLRVQLHEAPRSATQLFALEAALASLGLDPFATEGGLGSALGVLALRGGSPDLIAVGGALVALVLLLELCTTALSRWLAAPSRFFSRPPPRTSA